MKTVQQINRVHHVNAVMLKITILTLAAALGFSSCNYNKTNSQAAKGAVQSNYIRMTAEYISKNPDAARSLEKAIKENGEGDLETLVKEGKVYILEDQSP